MVSFLKFEKAVTQFMYQLLFLNTMYTIYETNTPTDLLFHFLPPFIHFIPFHVSLKLLAKMKEEQ